MCTHIIKKKKSVNRAREAATSDRSSHGAERRGAAAAPFLLTSGAAENFSTCSCRRPSLRWRSRPQPQHTGPQNPTRETQGADAGRQRPDLLVAGPLKP